MVRASDFCDPKPGEMRNGRSSYSIGRTFIPCNEVSWAAERLFDKMNSDGPKSEEYAKAGAEGAQFISE